MKCAKNSQQLCKVLNTNNHLRFKRFLVDQVNKILQILKFQIPSEVKEDILPKILMK